MFELRIIDKKKEAAEDEWIGWVLVTTHNNTMKLLNLKLTTVTIFEHVKDL